MRAIITGYGQMGKMLEGVLLSRGHEVAGIQDPIAGKSVPAGVTADVIFDFSHRSALPFTLETALSLRIPCVIGTTALTPDDLSLIRDAAFVVPVVQSSNYSLGVAVLKKAARLLSDSLMPDWDLEITETHHRKKADAPSGTALSLLRAVDPEGTCAVTFGREGTPGPRGHEIGMHSLRGGTVAGVHTLSFFGEEESITLTHTAESRRVFAVGAVCAAEKLLKKDAGLYTPDDLF